MFFIFATIAFVLYPYSAFAALSSENYVVSEPSFSTQSVTTNASSPQYVVQQAGGGTFEAGASDVSSGGSGVSSGSKIPSSVQGSGLGSRIVGPRTVRQGEVVRVLLIARTASGTSITSGGDTVVFTVDGANPSVPSVRDLKNGSYLMEYVADQLGEDVIVATLNGVKAGSDSDGVSDGELHVTVVAAGAPALQATDGDQNPSRASDSDQQDGTDGQGKQGTPSRMGHGSDAAHGAGGVGSGMTYDAGPLAFLRSFFAQAPLTIMFAVIVALGVVGGCLMALFGLARRPFSVTEITRVLHAPHVLGSLVASRKNKSWGTVYDSITRAPVDSAVVTLLSAHGEKLAETTTDFDGAYSFVVPPGNYAITVRRAYYIFPSKNVIPSGQDALYTNLYYGTPFVLTDTTILDIPIDPVYFDWNHYETLRTHHTRVVDRVDPIIARVLTTIFYAGFAVLLWRFTQEPSIATGLVFSFYILLLALRFLGGKPMFYGSIQKNGCTLPFAVVHVYRNDDRVARTFTDAYGRYAVRIDPGTYRMRVDERTGEYEYTTVFDHEIEAGDGVVNQSLSL